MKKLFISVPMRGRTEEEIRKSIEKMHKIAEIYEGEELELIDSYIEHKPPQNIQQSVWYLGESLKKLAGADVFIGIDDCWAFVGCCIERDVAIRYGIKRYEVRAPYVVDNFGALMRQLEEEFSKKVSSEA